ncbi:MAG: glycosyltransferase [Anaerolineales bacterium]|nr:glycosyltransferase [Anaerolineales bacterium]
MIKISVITWNGGFRESFHTVDSFAKQSFPTSEYEFIWAEYYDSADPVLLDKIHQVENAKVIFVNGEGQWHVGRCMNAGIAASRGDLLVLIDGDIVVRPDFLTEMWQTHAAYKNLVLYVRRWDEPKTAHDAGQISVEHLETVCQLNNPTNYGGCLITGRQNIESAQGYEEHPIIGGPGAVSKELYTRLCNAGFPIMWHSTEKIYHPWHFGTLPSTDTLQQQQQKWVIKQRGLDLSTRADQRQIDSYLMNYSEVHKSSVQLSIKKMVRIIPGSASLIQFLRWTGNHA